MIVCCHFTKTWESFYNMTEFSGVSFHLWICFRLESRVVHRYSHPGTFTVAAHCSSADKNFTACKVIAIHRPVRAFTLSTCYVGNLSLNASNCKALHGEELQIQMGVNAGRCLDDSNLTVFIVFNLVLHLKAYALLLWPQCEFFFWLCFFNVLQLSAVLLLSH